ncbi:MAG: 30S ribosomal protein S6 [Elusimicrobiaceae bacterium]|jgi:small subunit ribosomal protein S6|nr:30S ribosomal protein S6 [Elusimicrobiaceae bacterium]MBT3955335.1 30S ribosomal protein S6 [Elusimicrobiaceae bacterium]MBT4008471.1 30S ribosomal protein S6 [Elusimicrobiaceae bacterium]MBT4403359.1 30S ribosomal protein S6 [Elusimicrobiaceae bacterium]MBT4440200.1 30S ribosomal protein S6 [Elusimicrobiaceae bacterium]
MDNMHRNYEVVIVLKPQLSDKDIADFMENTKTAITNGNGEVVSEEKLGRKRLAHEIKKEREGFFLLFKFKSGVELLESFKKNLTLNESVLRHMVLTSEEVKNKSAK